MRGLFRRAALEAQRQSRLGTVSLAQPPRAWALALFALVAVALVLAFLTTAEYTRRSRVTGRLVPDGGLATLTTPEAGTVTRLFAEQGDTVRQGEPLAVIAISRSTAAAGDTTAALLARIDERRGAMEAHFASRRRLLEAQAQGTAAELRAAGREREQVEALLALGRERLRIAEELSAELARLAGRHFVSRVELAKQEQAVLEQAASGKELERLATSVGREVLKLEQRLAALELEREALRAEEKSALAELGQERVRIAAGGEVLVGATLTGTVASTLALPGQALKAGQPLLTLVPAGATLEAELLVPSRAIGFVEPGDAVLLRYQAFPHAKFGHHRGTVVAVSRNALDAEAVAALTGGAAAAEPLWRVVVAPERQFVEAYGARRALKPGMRVEADLLGERRRLYEWLLEPLYSVGGRL